MPVLVWGLGFEPRLMTSEAIVLPLDDPQLLPFFSLKQVPLFYQSWRLETNKIGVLEWTL